MDPILVSALVASAVTTGWDDLAAQAHKEWADARWRFRQYVNGQQAAARRRAAKWRAEAKAGGPRRLRWWAWLTVATPVTTARVGWWSARKSWPVAKGAGRVARAGGRGARRGWATRAARARGELPCYVCGRFTHHSRLVNVARPGRDPVELCPGCYEEHLGFMDAFGYRRPGEEQPDGPTTARADFDDDPTPTHHTNPNPSPDQNGDGDVVEAELVDERPGRADDDPRPTHQPGPGPHPDSEERDVVDAEIVPPPALPAAGPNGHNPNGHNGQEGALMTEMTTTTPAGGPVAEATTLGELRLVLAGMRERFEAEVAAMDTLTAGLTAQHLDPETLQGVSDVQDQLATLAATTVRVAEHVARQHSPVGEAVQDAGGPDRVADRGFYAEI